MKSAAEAALLQGPLRRAGQLALLALIAAGIAAAWRWRAAFDPVLVTAFIGRHPAAPLVFLALHVLASLLFVPRTLLAIVAGLAFGMWWGMLWAALGSLLGAIAGFLAARLLHPALIERASRDRLAPLLARAGRGGWRIVAMVRLVPIVPHSLANYALGLTGLRLGAYAFGSLVGQMPLTIAYVDFGAAGGRALQGAADWLMPSAIGAGALILSLLFPVLVRRRARQAPAA